MKETITNLYNQYRPTMLAFAAKRCGDYIMAEDMVQEVFLKLWLKKETWTNIDNLCSYLFVMLRNEIINYQRKQRLELNLLSDRQWRQRHVITHDALLEKEYRKALHAAIQRLPSQRRNVYQLSFRFGYNNEQIACKLNRSVKTIKCQLQMARKEVREYIRERLAA